MKKIKRTITEIREHTYRAVYGLAGSRVFTLNCGHVVARKRSQGIPSFVYCRECTDLASGRVAYVLRGNIEETWDAEKQMPVRTRR